MRLEALFSASRDRQWWCGTSLANALHLMDGMGGGGGGSIIGDSRPAPDGCGTVVY